MEVPKVRITQAKRNMNSITEAIDAGYIKSCHDLSEGGLAVAAAEMALSSDHGMKLNLTNVPVSQNMKRNDYILFSESNTRFLAEVPEKRREDFETLMGKTVCSAIGQVEKDERLCIYGTNSKRIVNASLSELRDAWKSTFEKGQ